MGIIISDKDKLIQDLGKKMTKVTDIYSTTHKVVHWGDVQAIVEKFFMDKNSDWLMAKTEPTISKMEQVDKDINVRSKDEPQIDNLATAIAHEAYCKTCKHLMDEDCDCDVVFTGYEPKDEPQTDCAWGKDG